MLAAGAGFADTVVEDGYVHVPAGNYIPALLMRQDTDLQAGRNLFGTCNVGTQRNRSFDYFWVQEHYGYLALVSAPTDTTGTLPPDDWSSVGNQTDGVDVAWGPFPPYQVDARACLAGTRVAWTLRPPASATGGTSCRGVRRPTRRRSPTGRRTRTTRRYRERRATSQHPRDSSRRRP
jgi:hypothetical protein